MTMRCLAFAVASVAFFFASTSAREEPCTEAFAYYNDVTSFDQVDIPLVPANLALACLRSMPFDSARALNWMDLWNTTILQLHTGTAYLRDPPPSYQKPSADLNKMFAAIKDKTYNGTYTNQYDFEADVRDLIQASHDGHLSVLLGGQLIWFFNSGINLVAVSDDGQELPKLYSYDDLAQLELFRKVNSRLPWTPSSIDKINGQDAADFVQDWAAQWSPGMTENHGEWNSVMHNLIPAGVQSLFARRNYHVGDWLNVTFANGSVSNFPWLASLNAITWSTRLTLDLVKSIRTGKDMYEALVIPPSPTDPDSPHDTSSSTSATFLAARASAASSAVTNQYAAGWGSAYPPPFLLQDNFGRANPTSAYLLEDESLAVLSLPSFAIGDTLGYQSFLRKFVNATRERGVKKLLIDTRGNPGGIALLAYETYKVLFPQDYPWAGARARYNGVTEILGNALSKAWENSTTDGETNIMLISTFTPQTLLDAETGQHFKDWDALSKPYFANGDWFMKNVLLDLNNSWVDFLTGGLILDGFGSNAAEQADPQPFAIEDMALLTDGICHSTCSMLYELLKHQLNVTTIAVGGAPVPGPMQDVSGVRGSIAGSFASLNHSFAKLQRWWPQYIERPLPEMRDTHLYMPHAGYNEWDQVRANETFPQHFAYHAADCRLFYTLDTYFSHEAMWRAAAAAAFDPAQRACVRGSTGHISAVQPYYTDVCGPFAAGCDPAMGFRRWGTSNHSVYSSAFYPTRFAKADNARFGDTRDADSEAQIYAAQGMPLNGSAVAASFAAAAAAGAGFDKAAAKRPASGPANAAAAHRNAAGTAVTSTSAVALAAFFAVALTV